MPVLQAQEVLPSRNEEGRWVAVALPQQRSLTLAVCLREPKAGPCQVHTLALSFLHVLCWAQILTLI